MNQSSNKTKLFKAFFAIVAAGFFSVTAAAKSTTHADLKLNLPAKPTEDIVDIGNGVKQYRLNINQPNGAIIVWHQQAADGVTDHDSVLQKAQDTIVKMAAGPVVQQKKTTQQGNPGREFTVSIPANGGEFRDIYY